MDINGRCHCGNIAYVLVWPDEVDTIPGRACGCTFCTKHGAVWTASPMARLQISVTTGRELTCYEFATCTAQFLICARCGAVAAATSEIDGQFYAVVNTRMFDSDNGVSIEQVSVSFGDESHDTRIARRRDRWIPDVSILHLPS